MQAYLDLVQDVLDNGELRADRTGTGTISMFGPQIRHDLREGFPVVTTKRLNWRAAIDETLWFLRGETNTSTLGSGIWDAWADERGNIGPGYGWQWRSWGAVYLGEATTFPAGGKDQVAAAIASIKADPTSRRHIVSAWNVGDLDAMALPPCHVLWQLYVGGITPETPRGQWLDLKLYQRSADLALGVPFNTVGYALILELIARECALKPRYLIHTFGDAHVYTNHVGGLRRQLRRSPRALPRLVVPAGGFDELIRVPASEYRLDGYDPHPGIRFEVAV
jgi:thymidylate synthase